MDCTLATALQYRGLQIGVMHALETLCISRQRVLSDSVRYSFKVLGYDA